MSSGRSNPACSSRVSALYGRIAFCRGILDIGAQERDDTCGLAMLGDFTRYIPAATDSGAFKLLIRLEMMWFATFRRLPPTRLCIRTNAASRPVSLHSTTLVQRGAPHQAFGFWATLASRQGSSKSETLIVSAPCTLQNLSLAQPKTLSVIGMVEWLTARQSQVVADADGYSLSTAAGTPCGKGQPAEPWISAKVPGTVLQALVAGGKCPDPFVDMQSTLIGDIGEVGAEFYTHWFCARFRMPKKDRGNGMRRQPARAGDVAWLKLGGVNYSLDIYANGCRLDPGEGRDRGTYLRRCLKLPDDCPPPGTWYHLAILVRPPDNFGKVPQGGGQGGDHALGMDVAPQFLEGWDWTLAMPDRSTGIWGSVSVSITGPIGLSDAHSRVSFPAGAVVSPKTVSKALVSCGVTVINSTSVPVPAECSLEISHEEDGAVIIDAVAELPAVLVPPGSTDLEFEPQAIEDARLWWPVNMGDQFLYRASISIRPTNSPANTAPSDLVETTVGVRVISSCVDEATGGRLFRVNGRKVFIRGGNYISSEAYLASNPQRLVDEVRLHALANVNMLRMWGGAGMWHPAMMDACDREGILLWLEFWITGDDDGRGSGDSQCPLDHALWLRCAEDAIRLARGHASLAIFVGGNEQEPCCDMLGHLQAMLARLAPDVGFAKGSLWDGFADGHGGDGYLNLHDGPYKAQDPFAFYAEEYYPYGFDPEIGSFSVPIISSLRRFISNGGVPTFRRTPDGLIEEACDETWGHYKHMSHSSTEDGIANQLACYGVPLTLEDYCMQAQMASYVQYRALGEGLSSKMWRKHTGFLLWKSQSPVPSLRGQLYDYYLQPTAALYGFKKACEPIHAQVCPITSRIVVVNTSDSEARGSLSISLTGLEGQALGSMEIVITAPPCSSTVAATLASPTCEDGTVYLVTLRLSLEAPHPSNPPSSPNVYWVRKAPPPAVMDGLLLLPRDGAQDEFLPLSKLRLEFPLVKLAGSAVGRKSARPPAWKPVGNGRDSNIDLSSEEKGVGRGDEQEWDVELNISNPVQGGDARPALLVRVSIIRQDDASEVLPCFATENFFTITAGDARNSTLSFRWTASPAPPASSPPVAVALTGWNAIEQLISIEWSAAA